MHRGGVRQRGNDQRWSGGRGRGNRDGEEDSRSMRGHQGSGRGGRHPSGLTGKEIGLFYASRSKAKKKDRELKEMPVVSLPRKQVNDISELLADLTDNSLVNASTRTQSSYKSTFRRHSGSIVTRDCSIDTSLLNDLKEKQNSPQYKDFLRFREKLPCYIRKASILESIHDNQVCVLSGETGCGKTTQVAQFILDDAIEAGNGSMCHIICTQPRRISAIAVAERVAAERVEHCGETCGYQIRLEGKKPRDKGSILYCTTGILLRRMVTDPLLSAVSHLIIDEIHERSLMSDFLLIIVKDILPKRPDLKVVLMSATLNAELFSSYFEGCPMLHVPGYTYPVDEYFLEDIIQMTNYHPNTQPQSYTPRRGNKGSLSDEDRENHLAAIRLLDPKIYSYSTLNALENYDVDSIDLVAIEKLVSWISREKEDGAILIFLPGWDDITKVHNQLTQNPMFTSSAFLLIPLHSMMPTATQKDIFARPPNGVRKIILSTNIAETSITIDDVVYVIDCGKTKEKTYDVELNITCLQPVWISKASATQRKGRAGRVQKGICYHLYTRTKYETLDDYQLPEMLRTPLEELCLQIKLLELGEIVPFLSKAIEPPHERALKNAIHELKQLDCLDRNECITSLGYHLAALPVHPKVGKMILFGAMFSCLDPILIIASSLGFKDPFVIPLHKQNEADRIRLMLSNDSLSDHIMLINAFVGWEAAKHDGSASEKQYCWDHFLSSQTLRLISSMRHQFTEMIYDVGFIKSKHPLHESSNVNSHNQKLIKSVICAGLYPNFAKVDHKSNYQAPPKLFTREDGRVCIHPKSVNANVKFFECHWLAYHHKMKSTKIYLYDTTMVSPFSLLFFGNNINFITEEGRDMVQVNDWIKFHARSEVAHLIKSLKSELDNLLRAKIKQPGIEILASDNRAPNPQQKLLQCIIDLISVEEIASRNNQHGSTSSHGNVHHHREGHRQGNRGGYRGRR